MSFVASGQMCLSLRREESKPIAAVSLVRSVRDCDPIDHLFSTTPGPVRIWAFVAKFNSSSKLIIPQVKRKQSNYLVTI